jgi:hypothetical protein
MSSAVEMVRFSVDYRVENGKERMIFLVTGDQGTKLEVSLDAPFDIDAAASVTRVMTDALDRKSSRRNAI